MGKKIKKNKFEDYVFIILGVTVLAISINMFYEPNNLVIGGFSGLGIIILYYSKLLFNIEIPLYLTNIVLNLPLIIAAWKIMGKNVIWRTVFGTVFLSFALIYTKPMPVFVGDMALVSIYGGVLAGVGVGLVFRGAATTGGSELVAMLIHSIKNHTSISKLLFIVDTVIIVLGFFVFGAEKAMYAIISVFVSSKCVDAILEGMSFSKAAFIISNKAKEISEQIMQKADRGVTALSGRGMYTGSEKDILLCVFSQKEITKIKEIVKEADKQAFIIVTDVREVLGEGFKSEI